MENELSSEPDFMALTPELQSEVDELLAHRMSWLVEQGYGWEPSLSAHRLVVPEGHEASRCFGLYFGQELAAACLVGRSMPSRWSDYAPSLPFCWISHLFSDPYKGGGHAGRRLLAAVERWADDAGLREIWLDCRFGDGYLPVYFRCCGYEYETRREWKLDQGLYDAALMVKRF